jgi:hypothetical protein
MWCKQRGSQQRELNAENSFGYGKALQLGLESGNGRSSQSKTTFLLTAGFLPFAYLGMDLLH